MFSTVVWPLLIHWLVLFVACYVVVEYAQNYLYDETTPAVGLKLAGGTLLLAAVLVWTRTSFDTMFTADFGKTVIQAIVWFAVFTLIFRFQPWHAVSIGVVSMVLLAGLATLASDSLLKPASRGTRPEVLITKPVRRPANIVAPSAKKAEVPAEVKKADVPAEAKK